MSSPLKDLIQITPLSPQPIYEEYYIKSTLHVQNDWYNGSVLNLLIELVIDPQLILRFIFYVTPPLGFSLLKL